MKGEELTLSCRELAHDLHDTPSGRVVLRQEESDALTEKLNAYEGRHLTLDERYERLELRDDLKRKETREAHLAKGIELMLGDALVSSYLLLAWPDDLATTIAAFVRRELDPERGRIRPTDARLKLFAPNNRDIYRSVYMHPSLGVSIETIRKKRIKKFGKPLTNTVDELPDKVRAKAAIPGVIAEILRQIEDGKSLEELRREGLLEVGSWHIELLPS